MSIPFKIRENSCIAKLAASKLSCDSMAIVIGKTIHLYNRTKEEFMSEERWVKHELCHVKQFHEHGFFTFLFKYLVESIRHGYYNNRYEKEARNAETQPG